MQEIAQGGIGLKNKTCAAYVCAFLLLAILVTGFVLSREKDEGAAPLPEENIEQTLVEVPEKEEKAVQFADIPKAKKEDVNEPAAEQNPYSPAKPNAVSVPEQKPEKEAPVIIETTIDNAPKTGNPPYPEGTPLPDMFLPQGESSASTDKKMQEKLVEEVFKTASVGAENGKITVSYKQPDIPPEYHLTVKAEVYDSKGKTYCRYVSDAGWLSESSNYDARSKSVIYEMCAGDLSDKMYILVVKVGDGDLLVGATVWQLTHNYDGTEELVKTYVE